MTAFIVSVDGPDFSGKSTVCSLLIERLRKELNGYYVRHTVLPSELVTGAFPKILRNAKDHVTAEAFSLAYAVDHLYHNETVIKPLVESKDKYIVILERSVLSTILYQSKMLGADLSWLLEINKHVKHLPNLTVLLDVKYDELVRRMRIEKRDFDKFETPEFVKKQIETYNTIPQNLVEKFNIMHIDANTSVEEIVEKLAGLVLKNVRK